MWGIVEQALYNQKKMRFQREHISCEFLLRKEAQGSLSNGDPRQRAKARRVQVLLGEGEVWLSLMIRGAGQAREGQAPIHRVGDLGFLLG